MKELRSVGLARNSHDQAESYFLRQLVDNRWFALSELGLVMMSAAAWMLIPTLGVAFSLIACLPWVFRFVAGNPSLRRTPFDLLMAIFLATAWIGYWAAYDKPAAWIKVWLIVSAVLLYYALISQPRENLEFLSSLAFCFALTLCVYFSLTYDFEGRGGRIAMWWMDHRPHVDWPAIHYDDVLGLILINAIFAFYWLWNTSQKASGSMAVVMQFFFCLGMGIVALVFALTVSRGIGLMGLGGGGLWALWKAAHVSRTNNRVRAFFPVLVLTFLLILITFVYLGPASADPASAPNRYGTNSRTELLERGAYFLEEYPVTGAGLASFPGLYSRYMLAIPHSYFVNSYNLFLDAAIEQGVTAGLTLIILYVGAVFLVSRSLVSDPSNEMQLTKWLGLCALIVTIVHGLFYDYLYHGHGTALLFYPLGMAIAAAAHPAGSAGEVSRQPNIMSAAYRVVLGTLLVAILILALGLNKIVSLWYVNLGAVQMSQVQLKGFPTGEWETSDIAPHLGSAESTFRTVLHYEPDNRSANYRLGLISMLRQDFVTAAAHLETAHRGGPNHRGIIKSLGYCYVWLGELDTAQQLLDRIPEAENEMKVYIWWWETQGRPDLSEAASQMVTRLSTTSE